MTSIDNKLLNLLDKYRVANDFWKSHWEHAQTDEESGVFAARDAVTEVMLYPCATAEVMVQKVTAILSDDELIKWISEEESMVRALLASFMCLKASAEQGELPLTTHKI
ncbi:hypothetical protein N5C66_15925 [Rhizobium pusense]|uniref:hypothetical protein n=1 Tax=Rhizobium/Agrobacterium group TaxID=227290 RepID=UPI000D1A0713|nr:MULTISPECIES: hypothetical protein [Rhizobium/Agrobacterium group]MDH0910649.1 hypothetical protein [Agrobacterium pusense]MDH1095595.1 hypothetical protein [Agrobacterium pusense]MDH1113227.1 hypothetical protein [Agrobacterium pusense]MDH2192921.1 hypothetical protein [Agrobacterium pusense]CAD7057965.1 hypothetical protein RP007_02046 [Rhizobium sp. P007]